jgi:hypothetical protein
VEDKVWKVEDSLNKERAVWKRRGQSGKRKTQSGVEESLKKERTVWKGRGQSENKRTVKKGREKFVSGGHSLESGGQCGKE